MDATEKEGTTREEKGKIDLVNMARAWQSSSGRDTYNEVNPATEHQGLQKEGK